jgi:hypothetical protein
MTINRHNVEAFLPDYLAGNLDPLLTAELMAFLAENPAFEKLLPESDQYALAANEVVYEMKNQLMKDFKDVPDIHEENFDEFCIAAAEGLLSEKDAQRLEKYIIRHPDKQKDLDAYYRMKLKPDLSLVFRGKTALMKQAVRPSGYRYLIIGMSLAASIVFIVLLFSRRNRVDSMESPSFSNNTESIISPVNPVRSVEAVVGAEASIRVEIRRMAKNNHAFPAEPVPETPDQHKIPPETDRQVFIPDKLEPVAGILNAWPQHERSLILPDQKTEDREHPRTDNNRLPAAQDEGLLYALLSRVDFWKTAETALNGFNYLTEAQLSISKTTDQQGNLKSLQFDTESFSFEGSNKIK